MDYAVTAQQMKAIDQNTIKNIGIPSMVLMERAALAVAEAAEHMAKERNLGKKARILAVCGTGNNGADGDLIKTSHTRWMAAQIPNSQLRLIEGGTHKVLFLREQQCMSYILDFLRRNHL